MRSQSAFLYYWNAPVISSICISCSGIGKQSGEMQEQWNSAANPHQRHYYGCQCHRLDHTGVSRQNSVVYQLYYYHPLDGILTATTEGDSRHWIASVSKMTWCVFHGFRSLLSEDELNQLEEACDMALELNQSKHRIYEYVESRMSFIAPNLSIIVGASTAAKIMGERLNKTSFKL